MTQKVSPSNPFNTILMSHCHALTKANKRCRSLALIQEKSEDCITYSHVCKEHTHFFTTFQPTEEMVEDLEYHRGLHIFFRDAIKEGLICVKEFIASLPAESMYAYFYLVCLNNAKGFQSSWNRPLHLKAFKMVWKRLNSAGPVYIHWGHLFLLAAIDGVEGFYTMLKTSNCDAAVWFQLFERASREEFFEQMYHIDISEHEAYRNDVIKHLTKDTPSTRYLKAYLEGIFLYWLKKKKTQRYESLRKRIPFKEELMEVAWNPDRMAWYLDEEQKARVKNEFACP
jgi:hypothetical protein